MLLLQLLQSQPTSGDPNSPESVKREEKKIDPRWYKFSLSLPLFNFIFFSPDVILCG